MVSDPPGTEERLSDVPPEGTLVPNPRAVVLAAAGNPAVCWMEMSMRKLWDIVKDRIAWHAAVQGVEKSWT